MNDNKMQCLTNSKMDMITTNEAYQEMEGPMKRSITKFSTGQFPIGEHMERLQLWHNDLCPCCLRKVECKTHLFQCNDNGAKTKKLSNQLWAKDKLTTIKTHPEIVNAIMGILKSISADTNNYKNSNHNAKKESHIKTKLDIWKCS